MYRMPFILFFGPDGSGKTTLARYLYYILSRKYKVKIAWMRGTHTLASLLARLLGLFNTFKGYDNPYYNIRIPSKLKRLWAGIEFISIIPIILIKYIIPSRMGYLVIGERSYPDFITWLIMTLRNPKCIRYIGVKFLISQALKARHIVYIYANLNELVRRRPYESRYISLELAIYNILFRYLDTFKIDTSNETIHKSLKRILEYTGLHV